MKILIGTLALNNIGITEGWLRSLYKNTPKLDNVEVDVIVIDNGSKENIPGMVMRTSKAAPYPTYILRNYENIGVAPGWNQILTFHHGYDTLNGGLAYDYYVISNNDIWFGPDWLEPLIKTMEENPTVGWASSMQNGNDEFEMTKEAHAILGQYRMDPHTTPKYEHIAKMMDNVYHKWGGFDTFCQAFRAQAHEPFHNGHSATCFMIRADMLWDIGFFCEYDCPIGIHEDHEYWERMDKDEKWQYRGVNDSIVHHHVCFTRKGPGFGDGHNYEVQRELNWRKMTGHKLFGIPGE